jgi:ribosomal protein L20
MRVTKKSNEGSKCNGFRYRVIRNRKCNIRRLEIREIVAGLEDQGVECPAI